MIFLKLFLGFLKVGLFTFGGGYGAIPLIREVVLSNGWLTEEALTYMIAVSESTPGSIMVNLATYVGSSQAGFFGSLAATAAVVLPSFCIILLIASVCKQLLQSRYVKAALDGLKPCIIGLILFTGFSMIITNCTGETAAPYPLRTLAVTLLLGVLLFCYPMLFHKKLSPIAFILIAAVLGALIF